MNFRLKTSTNIQQAIGRRMYPDPHMAIVELVSNSYDADADKVHVIVTADKIIVHDDGWGMTEDNLAGFFTIGKSSKAPSEKGREPIGTFGIGKFAILSMAEQFLVFSKSETGPYRSCAFYSHEAAIAAGDLIDDYEIEVSTYLTEEEYETALVAEIGTELYDVNKTGVCIIMKNLHRQYSDMAIRERLSEMLVPQAESEFSVFVNDELLEEKYVHGLRYDIDLTTEFGPITGEIVIAAESIDLADQAGVQIQVQSRGVYRTYFGLEGYDKSAGRLSGYVVANWLKDVISSNRTDLIASPEKTAFEAAVTEAIRSILDVEAQKRAAEDEERKAEVLNRAVRTVTNILNKLPEFDFPQRPMQSMIPVGILEDVLAGKDPAGEINEDGSMEATVSAASGAFKELLKYLREIAPQFNVDPSDVPTEVRTISELLDVVEKVLGVSLVELIGKEALEQLISAAIPEAEMEDEERIRGAFRLVSQRIEQLIREITAQEDMPTECAQPAEGVSLRTPITNSLELGKINLTPIAPPLDFSSLDLNINPQEDGYVPDAPQAQINNFVAASVEHLGEDGPASMVAEGAGFDGIQIYINADHPVYQGIKEDSPSMLAFYQAQLIFGEVILMQNFTPREAMDKQAELMRLLVNTDRKILKFK